MGPASVSRPCLQPPFCLSMSVTRTCFTITFILVFPCMPANKNHLYNHHHSHLSMYACQQELSLQSPSFSSFHVCLPTRTFFTITIILVFPYMPANKTLLYNYHSRLSMYACQQEPALQSPSFSSFHVCLPTRTIFTITIILIFPCMPANKNFPYNHHHSRLSMYACQQEPSLQSPSFSSFHTCQLIRLFFTITILVFPYMLVNKTFLFNHHSCLSIHFCQQDSSLQPPFLLFHNC